MHRKQTANLTSMLNRQIEIFRTVEGMENELVDVVYAAIIPQTGNMLQGRVADTVLTRVTHKFVIRYRPDLTTDMYIMYGGQRFDIVYILDPYANHERLEIFTEGVIQ